MIFTDGHLCKKALHLPLPFFDNNSKKMELKNCVAKEHTLFTTAILLFKNIPYFDKINFVRKKIQVEKVNCQYFNLKIIGKFMLALESRCLLDSGRRCS